MTLEINEDFNKSNSKVSLNFTISDKQEVPEESADDKLKREMRTLDCQSKMEDAIEKSKVPLRSITDKRNGIPQNPINKLLKIMPLSAVECDDELMKLINEYTVIKYRGTFDELYIQYASFDDFDIVLDSESAFTIVDKTNGDNAVNYAMDKINEYKQLDVNRGIELVNYELKKLSEDVIPVEHTSDAGFIDHAAQYVENCLLIQLQNIMDNSYKIYTPRPADVYISYKAYLCIDNVLNTSYKLGNMLDSRIPNRVIDSLKADKRDYDRMQNEESYKEAMYNDFPDSFKNLLDELLK